MSGSLNDMAAVFFDFGDTLVTLHTPRESLFIRAAESIGLQLSGEAVELAYQIVDFSNKYSSVTVTDRDQFYRQYNQRICEALGISSYFEKLEPAITEEFSRNSGWVLFDDVIDVLSELKRLQLRLAIVANWDSNLGIIAERLGIKQFFSSIVPSQVAAVEKPDPEIFKIALRELSLTDAPDKVYYVGNEYPADVLGARAAGLIPVLIDRKGYYQHADCLRFRSLSEMLGCIRP